MNQEVPLRVHVAHQDLGHAVRRGTHVGDEEVGAQIAVDIAAIGPHAVVRRVRQQLASHVAEPAVAFVVPQYVRALEVVRDVEIRPAVAIVVTPCGRQPHSMIGHACCGGRIDEATAVVPQQAIRLASHVDAAVERKEVLAQRLWHLEVDRRFPTLQPLELWVRRRAQRRHHLVGPPPRGLRWRDALQHFGHQTPAGVQRAVGRHVDVKVTVLIEIAKRRHRAGSGNVEAKTRGALFEGAIAAIAIEQVLRLHVADIEIQPAVAVDVRERGAGAPGLATIDTAGARSDVFESQRRRLAKQSVGAVLANQIQVR